MKTRITLIALILAAILYRETPSHAQLNVSGGLPIQPMKLNDGTCAAPTYSFGSNSNIGLSNAGGDLQISIAGVCVWRFADSAGSLLPMVATVNIGSSGAPVLGITGATVTGGATSTVILTTANLSFRGNSILKDGSPTCSGGGCVVLANSINSAGSVSTTTTGAADITITFSANFQHAPVCLGDNATTGNLLRATTEAVGSFHLQGVTASGDTLGYVCIGN